MSNRTNDFELRLVSLEREWGSAYEASRSANAALAALSAGADANLADLHAARRRLERAEELKAQVLAKIERFEVVATQQWMADE